METGESLSGLTRPGSGVFPPLQARPDRSSDPRQYSRANAGKMQRRFSKPCKATSPAVHDRQANWRANGAAHRSCETWPEMNCKAPPTSTRQECGPRLPQAGVAFSCIPESRVWIKVQPPAHLTASVSRSGRDLDSLPKRDSARAQDQAHFSARIPTVGWTPC